MHFKVARKKQNSSNLRSKFSQNTFFWNHSFVQNLFFSGKNIYVFHNWTFVGIYFQILDNENKLIENLARCKIIYFKNLDVEKYYSEILHVVKILIEYFKCCQIFWLKIWHLVRNLFQNETCCTKLDLKIDVV